MPDASDPYVLAALALAAAGIAMLVQSRTQVRMLRRRVVAGPGTIALDPVTGLFSAAAAWQCIRGEANRAGRIGRPLFVWVGTAPDATALDALGHGIRGSLPESATGIRVARQRVCVVSCAVDDAADVELPEQLTWSSCRIEPGEDAATRALGFLSEAIAA